MIWLTILVALSIPLAAVILDSPVVRSFADRKRHALGDLPAAADAELARKVETLEAEVESLTREIGHLKEGQQFLQQMLQDPDTARALPKLPKPPA